MRYQVYLLRLYRALTIYRFSHDKTNPPTVYPLHVPRKR